MNNRKRNALIAILILFSILALGSGYIKKSDAKNTEKEIVNSLVPQIRALNSTGVYA